MKCRLKTISSLEKVFFELSSEVEELTSGSMLKNELYSFQLVVRGEEANINRLFCKVEIESELKSFIEMKRVGYVPTLAPSVGFNDDDDYLCKKPGLFPDALYRVKNGEIDFFHNQDRAYWITIDPKSQVTGKYPIVMRLVDYEDQVLAETCFTIDIIDAELPQTDVRNTGWFHGDCIAKLHNVEVMSDEYWEIVEKYIANYTRFGHNMILTPIFTPPLDTAIGRERPTNQLVEVSCNQGKYSFGFCNLKKWLDLCRRYGIRFFEMAHLFSQWGAKHAPKIMATVDGDYRRIFGWETDSLSEEYHGFMDVFLPALVDFLKEEEVFDNCYFHVSDEPNEAVAEQYRSVKQMVLPHVPEKQWIDALSNYTFYEKGIVAKPIVSNNHIHTFIEHGVENLWTYYCESQRKDVANRFIAMPSYRNRILGYQLYKYKIEGFLHWGYNFWFSCGSIEAINPYIDNCAGGSWSSGDPFIVYPLDKDGEVGESLRLYVFHEGFQDLRALELLERVYGREHVLKLLEEIDGFGSYPRNTQYIVRLRERVNKMIKSYVEEQREVKVTESCQKD